MSIHPLRPARARLIIVAVVLALAGLLLAAIPGGSARAAPHPVRAATAEGVKPTIVLVHGAWADSGSWNAVTALLQAAGYTVDAPPNPLRGLSYDASYLADFLSTISGPVVLAATQRPLAASTLTEPSGTPAWKSIPSWAVIGTADHVIPLAEQLNMARNAGAHVTEINAPHLSMISDPGPVAAVIIRAARVTG